MLELPDGAGSATPQPKHNIAESYLDVTHGDIALTFSASPDANSAANSLIDNVTKLRNLFADWEKNHPQESRAGTPDELTTFHNNFDEILADFYRARTSFNDAARKDLGLPPLHT